MPSRDRLALANLAGVLELALDASDTVAPKNSLEKMLVHQMAVIHRQTMKLSAQMDDLSSRLPLEGLQHQLRSVPSRCLRSRAWRRRISLACSRCNVSAPAASRSLSCSTCMSLMVAKRSSRRSLVVRGRGETRNIGGGRENDESIRAPSLAERLNWPARHLDVELIPSIQQALQCPCHAQWMLSNA